MKPSITLLPSRSSWLAIGLVTAVSAVLIGLVLLLHFWKGVPIGNLTRDPVSIIELPIYTGFLSQTTIFFWAATATVCLFSVSILSKRPNSDNLKGFLLDGGLLTFLLGLDDVFLLHEKFFPYLGFPERWVYISYIGLVLLYLVRFRFVVLRTEFVLLAMALGFFGLSALLDEFPPFGINPYLFEDGTKLIGVVAWFAYFFRVALSAVDRGDTLREPRPTAFPRAP